MMSIPFRYLLAFSLSGLLVGCAPHMPAPVSGLGKDYNAIERGSYRGSYYQVKSGDTLYFISYITDKDVKEIIRYNNLAPPYVIHPGDRLKLWGPKYTPPVHGSRANVTRKIPVTSPVIKVPSTISTPTTKVASASNSLKNTSKVGGKTANKGIDQGQSKEYVGHSGNKNVNAKLKTPNVSDHKISKWLWPTKGRIISQFSAGDQGNRGIDIAGQRGQSIVSTASGTVVYSGNALRGYGNLIIIKHNDNYISAYAHNDRLLVKEGQSVRGGQKIATMGSSGSTSVRLHFEIRYQGKSVNPKRYLP
ncbi:peptidoglycan DD-metalloendopeptidase family protein [Vibrio tritonius]|uniref:peptidoglycan DD-metalloendopeptidase family protein n=1 Tax=Vibrio tritonius TaxID=1435069 RepID=UPI00315DE114